MQRDINRIVLYDGAGEELAKWNGQPKLEVIRWKARRLRDAKYPHIVFLGTGSSSSAKYRGSAAILVNIT